MMDKMMNLKENWIPGKQRGKLVNVRLNLPVRFKFDSEESAETKIAKKTERLADNTLEVLSFSMSPNPVKDQLHISFEVANYQGLSLQVSDSNGGMIGELRNSFSQSKNETTIDLSKASTGMLFVTLRNGEKVFTKQVIKQ